MLPGAVAVGIFCCLCNGEEEDGAADFSIEAAAIPQHVVEAINVAALTPDTDEEGKVLWRFSGELLKDDTAVLLEVSVKDAEQHTLKCAVICDDLMFNNLLFALVQKVLAGDEVVV